MCGEPDRGGAAQVTGDRRDYADHDLVFGPGRHGAQRPGQLAVSKFGLRNRAGQLRSVGDGVFENHGVGRTGARVADLDGVNQWLTDHAIGRDCLGDFQLRLLAAPWRLWVDGGNSNQWVGFGGGRSGRVG